MSSDVQQSKNLEEFVDAKQENLKELQEYTTDKNVILIGFIGTYFSKRYNPAVSASASFNIRDEFGIEKILNEIKSKIPKYKTKKLYLLINSMGGALNSAYKISKAIRENFDNITVFVPHYALSGGTLLALIGDEIRLGLMSQLGPLDIQLPYNDQTVSVNSLFNAQEALNDIFSTKTAQELPYPYVHMAEKLDPIILQEWAGIKREGEYYLREILGKAKYDSKILDKIVEYLMFRFPTHGFVIQYDAAKEIGINVKEHSEDLEAWNIMKFWLSNYINKGTDRHFIRYVIPEQNKSNDNSDKK